MHAPLVCPACGVGAPPTERFCARCGTPLIIGGDGPQEFEADERRIKARKVHPPYAEGELVRVAGARHLAEAELIQGLLLEAGVPSLARRARGFDVPDFLAAGPRDILVPAGGVEAARDMLRPHDMAGVPLTPRPQHPRPRRPRPPWVRALAFTVVVLIVALLAALVWAAAKS